MVSGLSNGAKENFKSILTEAVRDGIAPALVFGVSNTEGELLFASASSQALADVTDVTVDENSIFWVCSHTKLVTTIAALQLVEQGKLDLDAPVSQFAPELSKVVVINGSTLHETSNDILVRHLFNHTSGISYEKERVISYGLPRPYSNRFTQEDPIGMFFKLLKRDYPGVPLKDEPGSSFVYGYSTEILGFIVQHVSGKSLEQYFKDHIFTHVGMTTTSFHRTPELTQRAIPIALRDTGDQGLKFNAIDEAALIELQSDNVNIYLGGMGLHTSLRDNLALLRHLLRIYAGLPVSSPVLSQEAVKSLFIPTLSDHAAKALNDWATPQRVNDYNDLQWGNGLCLNTTDWPGKRRKCSGWWFGWAGTYFMLDPTTGIAVILGAQVIPTRDPQVIALWKKLEEAVYAGLL